MGNFIYGKKFEIDFHDVFSYDKNAIQEIISKNRKEEDGTFCNGMYSRFDSILLSCMLREKKPKTIIEVGGGCTTNIIMSTLKEVDYKVDLTTYAEELQSNIISTPDNISFNFISGNFLETFSDINIKDVNLCFIDGAHHAYFALYYFYNVMQKLSVGSIIHIHDIQNPEVLYENYRTGHITKHPIYMPEPTPTCEIYALYILLKEHKDRYRVLCNTNDMFYADNDETYGNLHGCAPSESLWIEVVE